MMAKNAQIFTATMRKLIIWIIPVHLKDWAVAMLNESEYIESRSEAVHWIVQSVLFTIKERSIYELEKTLMNYRAFTGALSLIALAVGLIAGTYAIQKPYQQ